MDTSDSSLMFNVTDRATERYLGTYRCLCDEGSGFLDAQNRDRTTVIQLEDNLDNKMVYNRRRINLSSYLRQPILCLTTLLPPDHREDCRVRL